MIGKGSRFNRDPIRGARARDRAESGGERRAERFTATSKVQ